MFLNRPKLEITCQLTGSELVMVVYMCIIDSDPARKVVTYIDGIKMRIMFIM